MPRRLAIDFQSLNRANVVVCDTAGAGHFGGDRSRMHTVQADCSGRLQGNPGIHVLMYLSRNIKTRARYTENRHFPRPVKPVFQLNFGTSRPGTPRRWYTENWPSQCTGSPVSVYLFRLDVPVPFCNFMRSVTTFASVGAAGHTDNQVGRLDPPIRYLYVREGNRKVMGS